MRFNIALLNIYFYTQSFLILQICFSVLLKSLVDTVLLGVSKYYSSFRYSSPLFALFNDP